MPDDFLRRYTAPQIAEIQAHYLLKSWEREVEEGKREIEQQRAAAQQRVGRRRR